MLTGLGSGKGQGWGIYPDGWGSGLGTCICTSPQEDRRTKQESSISAAWNQIVLDYSPLGVEATSGEASDENVGFFENYKNSISSKTEESRKWNAVTDDLDGDILVELE